MDLLRIYRTEPRGFRLVGELDLSCLDLLKPLEQQAESPGDLRVDLARLKFVDGAGIDRIATLAVKLRPDRLIALRPQKSVERQLKRMCTAEKLDNLIVSRLDPGVTDSFEARHFPRDLDSVIASDYTPEGVCGLICELATGAIRGSEGSAVALRSSGRPAFGAASNQLADAAAHLELQLGIGPALESLRLGVRRESPSLVTEKRWGEFTTGALYAGVASVLAVPLPVHNSPFGSLALYSTHENAFNDVSFDQAATFAARAAVALANATLYWQATDLCDQLKEALESRAAIDQAKGILMARDHISGDEAFGVLLRTSQTGNIKVRDIALKIIEGVKAAPTKDEVS